MRTIWVLHRKRAAGESEIAVPPVKIAISIVDYKNLYGKLNKKRQSAAVCACIYRSLLFVTDLQIMRLISRRKSATAAAKYAAEENYLGLCYHLWTPLQRRRNPWSTLSSFRFARFSLALLLANQRSRPEMSQRGNWTCQSHVQSSTPYVLIMFRQRCKKRTKQIPRSFRGQIWASPKNHELDGVQHWRHLMNMVDRSVWWLRCCLLLPLP